MNFRNNKTFSQFFILRIGLISLLLFVFAVPQTVQAAEGDSVGKMKYRFIAEKLWISEDYDTVNEPLFNITLVGEIENLGGTNWNRTYSNLTVNQNYYELNTTLLFQGHFTETELDGWTALYESSSGTPIEPMYIRNWTYGMTKADVGTFNVTFPAVEDDTGTITIQFQYTISDPDVRSVPALWVLILPLALIIGLAFYRRKINKKDISSSSGVYD